MSSGIWDQSEKLLVAALGFENVASPYVTNLLLKEEICAQFLETICIHEYKRVEAWLSGKYGPRSKEAMYWLRFGDRSLDFKLKTGNGLLVSLIVTRETVTIEEAIRIIIGGCNLWQLGSYLDEKTSGCPSTVSRRGISSVVSPERLFIDNKNYSKSNEIYIRNYSGVIDSGVISYYFNDCYILSPLVAYQAFGYDIPIDFLSLGLPNGRHSLLNSDSLNLKKNSTVLFFDNFRLGSEISSRINDSSVVSNLEYISTSNYGGFCALDNADIACSRRQNIILIPRPTKESYISAIDAAEKLLSAGALSVRIYNECVVEYPKADLSVDTDSISDPFCRFLLNNSYSSKDHELFNIVNRIERKSLNLTEFRRWAISVMLIQDSGVVATKGGLPSIVKNMGDLVDSPIIQQSKSSFSLDNLLRPKKFMQIVGSPNSGKTVGVTSILVALSDGSDVFMFKDNSPRRILLVDCETGESDLQKIYKQCKQILAKKNNSVSNIDYISLMDLQEEIVFDLTSETTQSELLDLVSDKKYDLFVIDNLHSLDSNLSSSKPKWEKVYKLFVKLGLMDVAVLLLHHTPSSDNTKPHGISRLLEAFHTIIVLEGPDALAKELGLKDDTEVFVEDSDIQNTFFSQYAKYPGTFIRMRFTKCKPDPRLEKHTFQYHLPFVDITKCDAKNWVADPENYSLESSGDLSKTEDRFFDEFRDLDLQSNLSVSTNSESAFDVDCKRVMEFAAECNYFNGSQIKRKFSWPKRYVTRIFRHLVQSKLLDYTGKTSDTKYFIRFNESMI